MPLTPFCSFADRGFYEDWVTGLFDAFYHRVLTPASPSGTRHPGTNSPASGTSPCTIFCCDTSTRRPSLHTSSRASAPCSSPFSSPQRRTNSSWLWSPKRSGALIPHPLPYHRLCMILLTTKYGRMYLFALQLIQIPLIAVGRTSVIKRNNLLGNTVFWLGLYAGFPLLCVAYVLY